MFIWIFDFFASMYGLMKIMSKNMNTDKDRLKIARQMDIENLG